MTARIRVDGTLVTAVPVVPTPEIVAAYKATKIPGAASTDEWLGVAWPNMLAAAPASYAEAVVDLVEHARAMVARARQQDRWHLMLDGHAQDLMALEAALRRITVEVDDAKEPRDD